MNAYLKIDPWCIIENDFNPANNRASESIFSIGNGRFGQRANFEEAYSGKSLQGNYIAGVYYPDKTRVGWWKNGYPEYFAKVLNAPNWIGIDIKVGNETLDLATCKVESFKRVLNMKEGVLYREFIAELPSGKKLKANIIRFISLTKQEIGMIRYSISPVNFSGSLSISSFVDGAIRNADANYDEYFWTPVSTDIKGNQGFLTSRTRKTEFEVCVGMNIAITLNEKEISPAFENTHKTDYIASTCTINLSEKDEIVITKIASVLSSLYHSKEKIRHDAEIVLNEAVTEGFDKLYKVQKDKWAEKWEHSDIVIEGDDAAQQGIRFNIFQLNQTYTGDDERLNIGPKGFTGEKYGGTTYWDTEAYCLPFFLCTAEQRVSRNLLVYRYKHLQKAIENAQKLGFKNGAALYPMVTINGEECHNEWEITFEEIHRNGAIAYAIYNYIKHTGDRQYLVDYGLEVLIAISRFWSQRVNFSTVKGKYVMLGVTGPNEYENNVNNNWYSNTLATWTMAYTIESIKYVKDTNPQQFKSLKDKVSLNEEDETKRWADIVSRMYYPYSEEEGVFLQQEGYMDKEQITSDQLDPSQKPINQHWSWDRILRSCFIKQADLLQGMYIFEDRYDTETIRKHFNFYEPRTLHESSLSPCVHTILACRIGNINKAYELYLRTSRLDIDDYNNEVAEGLHITSMAGTWMSVVEGFSGKRVGNGILVLNPLIPQQWKSYSFRIIFRQNLISVKVTNTLIFVENMTGPTVKVQIYGQGYEIRPGSDIEVKTITTYNS